MRVYWSGAWYFLQVDTRLRRQSGGRVTLDSALRKLNDCCGDLHLSVAQIVDELDKLNQVFLFRPTYEQVRKSTALPAYEKLFASLGISVSGGSVALDEKGPGAQLRRQIAKGAAL